MVFFPASRTKLPHTCKNAKIAENLRITMSRIYIMQNGVLKSVPSKHAAILVAIKKASYPPEPETDAPGQGEVVDAEAPKPKRTYVRKDLTAEA
jgi:hypothetical protein